MFSSTHKTDSIPVKGYKLFWNDEFDGKQLDTKKWVKAETSGNHGGTRTRKKGRIVSVKSAKTFATPRKNCRQKMLMPTTADPKAPKTKARRRATRFSGNSRNQESVTKKIGANEKRKRALR